jgi:hypothetical protein
MMYLLVVAAEGVALDAVFCAPLVGHFCEFIFVAELVEITLAGEERLRVKVQLLVELGFAAH